MGTSSCLLLFGVRRGVLRVMPVPLAPGSAILPCAGEPVCDSRPGNCARGVRSGRIQVTVFATGAGQTPATAATGPDAGGGPGTARGRVLDAPMEALCTRPTFRTVKTGRHPIRSRWPSPSFLQAGR
ncbi:hypothetical protein GCM10022222_58650 [Amycolatopsis ultiminotia]|uniref:Secreted protein n=1 Tax=Amycolatopsis ultiminotia TaxID=543629 RepID=A0ABP6XGX5_9PSEU